MVWLVVLAHGGPVAEAAVRVSPVSGDQRTTFRINFEASGPDVGPDDFGDELILRGPSGTPCAGKLVHSWVEGFASGPGRFLAGPRARRPAFGDGHERSYRPADPWCPGTYRGEVVESYASSTASLGTFSFRVRGSGAGPGRLRPYAARPVDRLPPDNRGVTITPRRIAPRTVVTVAFDTGLRSDQYLGFRLYPPSVRRCGDIHEDGGVFRPGTGRLRIGFRARDRGGNDRSIRVPRPMCRGRWIGYVESLPFTFVVR